MKVKELRNLLNDLSDDCEVSYVDYSKANENAIYYPKDIERVNLILPDNLQASNQQEIKKKAIKIILQ